MQPRRIPAVVAVVIGAAMVAAGCGGGSSGPETDVGLTEYRVTPDPVEVDAGAVEVTADNIGGLEHELVIVEADSAAALPTKPDGSVDEEQLDPSALKGEIEDVDAGEQKSKSFDLEPGSYVFFCNLVDEEGGQTISHFERGMHEVVTVTS